MKYPCRVLTKERFQYKLVVIFCLFVTCLEYFISGKPMTLRDETEEVAGFYARMIEHEYTTKEIFNNNFMEDWRKVMSDEERKVIRDLKKCNFREIYDYYTKVRCFGNFQSVNCISARTLFFPKSLRHLPLISNFLNNSFSMG